MISSLGNLNALMEDLIVLMEAEINACSASLDQARKYAEMEFEKAGMSLDEELPDFNKNYELLQRKCREALDIPRIEMPVIEPEDMAEFDERLRSGHIDIFPPYAHGKLIAPKKMTPEEGDEWIKLGTKDGDPDDDVVEGLWTHIRADKLLPTQSQIWLGKIIGSIIKFGVPTQGSSVTETTIIVSDEGYILDGHHRFGQVILANPGLRMKALKIPLDIDLLLTIGRSFGAAIGNEPKP